MRSILRVIKNEVAPCDDCNKTTLCKEEKLACRAFVYYVSTGGISKASREPNEAMYKKIFEYKTKEDEEEEEV